MDAALAALGRLLESEDQSVVLRAADLILAYGTHAASK